MNPNVKNIFEIVENVKEFLQDHQYLTIMNNLMILNYKKNEEAEEETDEETIEELHRQIIFLNGYIPTLKDENLKSVFTRRLFMLQCYSTEIS